MAKLRTGWTSEAEYKRALGFERRALRAVVTRLLESHLPFETVRSLCYHVMTDLVTMPQQVPRHRVELEKLASEALESVDTLIDEMVEQQSRGES